MSAANIVDPFTDPALAPLIEREATKSRAASTSNGATTGGIEPEKDTEPAIVVALKNLKRRAPNDPTLLLGNGYLCRGGGLLMTGPTGVGKSSFAMQCAVSWAAGAPCFDIRPAKALKVAIIQAENDDGDMAEMRDGVFAGLSFSDRDRVLAGTNVVASHEDSKTGEDFFNHALTPLLEAHRPDIVIIDPALAYLGDDANSQKAVSGFLRNMLNPLLRRFECGAAIVHHTNKPPSGKEKPEWRGSDFAYLGAGSAEWANWARAVLSIRQAGADAFELRAGKRGARLGWRAADGETPTCVKAIAHYREPGVICWRELSPDELPNEEPKATRPQKTTDDVMAHVPTEGRVLKETLWANCLTAGISDRKLRSFLPSLIEAGRLFEHREKRIRKRDAIYLSRHAAPADSDNSQLLSIAVNDQPNTDQ